MTSRFTKSEKSTKHFVRSQFPDFFLDEGEGIVDFVHAYYDHFSANTGNKIRDLQLQGDIDTTSNTNLIRFNNKYTFGSGRFIKELPAVITGDLRFIIKHIKDLYRSKGTERGIKLFFRLAFDDDPEVFTPGNFLFRPSDSVFRRSNIVEVEQGDNNTFQDLVDLEGQEIVGSVTGSSAIVRNVFKKCIGNKEFIYLDLENVSGNFLTGDKLTLRGANRLTVALAPKVIGPVNDILVEFGSENIPLGTEFTALPKDDGVELKTSVLETSTKRGTFSIDAISGYGYSNKSAVIVTRSPEESDSVTRGRFTVSTKNPYSTHTLNGELIQTFSSETIGNTTINGVVLDSANGTNAYNVTGIGDILSFEDRTYGEIDGLIVNEQPRDYLFKPFVAVKDVAFTANLDGNFTIANTKVTSANGSFAKTILHVANTLSGNVTVTIANNKIIGTGTTFQSDFKPFDVIKVINNNGQPRYFNVKSVDSDTIITIQQNSTFDLTGRDYTRGFVNFLRVVDSTGASTVRVVNNFVNSTTVFLDDKILSGEVATQSNYKVRVGYLTSNVNYSSSNDPVKRLVKSGSTFTDVDAGKNASFVFDLATGLNSVRRLQILNSGFGYDPNEEITLRSEDLAPEINITGGGGAGATAIPVIAGGAITSVIITNGGSGYTSTPSVTLTGGTGSGAVLTAVREGGSIVSVTVSNGGSEFFTERDIIVRVVKGGQSILEGQHVKFNSEPNKEIRIQDSNFWQEYSYEIESSIDSEKYVEVVDNLIHMSGRKFFTKNFIKDDATDEVKILEESVTASGV